MVSIGGDVVRLYLFDTFNDRVVSVHRTPQTAASAARKILDAIAKRSPGAYLPLSLLGEWQVDDHGHISYEPVSDDIRDAFDDAMEDQ